MKSLSDILEYYRGIGRGGLSTSRLEFKSAPGRVDLGDNRRDIDSALLYDADRLTKAALACYLAASHLCAGGHRTWGEITLYYAEFHVITALLKLAGEGLVDNDKRLLIRTDEMCHSYKVVRPNDELARQTGFESGGSHKRMWKMFSRRFMNWADSEPSDFASRLEEDPSLREAHMQEPYEFRTSQRNEANYLQTTPGGFFFETDMSGLQAATIGNARIRGKWDWLRKDKNPFSREDPPEADFFEEMMAWDLIKYTIKGLVALEGQQLLKDYIWIIKNLDAFDELKQHMLDDLQSMGVE